MAAPGRTHAITCTAPTLNGGDANGLFFLNLADPLLSDIFTHCLASGLDIAVTAVGSSTEYTKALSNWNYAGNSGCLIFVVPTTAASTVVELSFGGTTTTADQSISSLYGGTVNGFWPLDEAAGDGIDFGPNGYDLTHVGLEAQGVAAEIENGTSYEPASTSRSTQATAGDIEWSTARTVSIWVRQEAFGINPYFISRYNAAIFRGFAIQMDGNTVAGPVRLLLEAAAVDRLVLNGTTNLSTGAWTHICWSHDGSGTPAGSKLCINGVQDALNTVVNTLNAGTSITAQDMQLGRYVGNSNYLDGQIDNAMILSGVAASVEQMQDLHTLQNAYSGPNTGWTFGATRSLGVVGQSRMHLGLHLGL